MALGGGNLKTGRSSHSEELGDMGTDARRD